MSRWSRAGRGRLALRTLAAGVVAGVVAASLLAVPASAAAAAPAANPQLPRDRAPDRAATAKDGSPELDPGTVLVRFKPGTSLAAAAGAAERSHASLRAAVGGTRFAVVATNGADPSAVAARLRADPSVEAVEPNYMRTAFDIPNDTFFSSAQGYLETLHLPQAWSATHGSAGLRIAVLDTGVDLGNAEFAGRLRPGWNFVSGTSNAQDDKGHGTEVAGITAAKTNNSFGIAGTAWNASIIPVKVLDNQGVGTDANIAAGITWATDQGASIINLSLGGPGSSQVLHDAVGYALAHNVVVVAAAGNSSSTVPQYPAAETGVLAVAATDATGDAAWFSEHGPWVDVAAPGIDIAAPNPFVGPPGFTVVSGSSFSSPIVAGIALLVRAQHPTWTNTQVVNWLQTTATDRGPSGIDDTYGHGLVDAWAAVGGPGATSPGPAPKDGLEPNDVPARVTPLAVGQSKNATISPEGDVDWYEISLPSAASLSVLITPPPVAQGVRALEMDPVVQIDTADNRPLQTVDSGGAGVPETVTIAAAPGPYHVSVRNFTGSRSPGAYSISASISPGSGGAPPTTDPEWVRSTSPADFAVGVGTTTSPSMQFGRALNAATVDANTMQLIDGVTGAPTASTASYNAANQTVTITPAQPLSTNHPYAVHVGDVSDLAANVFAGGYTFRFRSAGPPAYGFPVKTFYLRDQVAPGPPDNTIPYGTPGCIAVTGDWDGNGSETIGAYCGGMWYLRNSNTPGPPDIAFAYGVAGYTPVVGDWNGDGSDTVGAYVNGSWFLRNSTNAGAPDIAFAYGGPGYQPVVGDWVGNGKDGIGVFVNGSWFLHNTPGPGLPDASFAYGAPGYRPVVGDWDGDHRDGIGCVAGSTWFVRNAPAAGPPDLWTSWGSASYELLPADWNGDHVTTMGVAG